MIVNKPITMPEQSTTPSPENQTGPFVAEYVTVRSVFVRQRNCLLVQADFAPLFVDYYLHLMQHGLRNEQTEDEVFKDLLALFTLHLVARPWQEHHAWTFNVKTPSLANYFVAGSSLTEDVVGRVFCEDVREPESNILYAQVMAKNKDVQTSVIPLAAEGDPVVWVEEFYRRSEQRAARAFRLGGDSYALITAEPGADFDWLYELTPDQVANLTDIEETKQLETRNFTFRCGCTVDRILPTLRAMQRDFADLLAEQGYIEVSCPRCGVQYRITPDMLGGSDTAPDACS